jgi:hypothetical protein
MSTVAEQFRALYQATLLEHVTRNPRYWGYGPDRVPAVAQSMVAALCTETAHVSVLVEQTARTLGIPPTATAIREALTR